jgi:putative addiction module antidote
MTVPVKPLSSEVPFLQFRKIGNSVGMIFPKEMLTRLGFAEGDTVMPIEQPDKSLTLKRFDAKHARAMEAARWAMTAYADTFRELAK